jgi:type IV pilus assembly protein PilP
MPSQTQPAPPVVAAPKSTQPEVTRPTVATPASQPAAHGGRSPGGVPKTAELTPSTADQKKPAGKETPEPYNPQGKIDPFEPLYKDEPEIPAASQHKHKKRVPRTPLERIDLGQLKLVGIIVAPSGNRALVQEASGKGYIIKEGTYIGLNSGRVAEIQPDRVIIEEEIEDIVGKYRMRKKEIVLPKPPGE